MLDLQDIFLSFQLAVLAFVICEKLMQQGHILEWYLDLLLKLETKAKFLAKPLGLCSICFSGQLSFWVWIYRNSFFELGKIVLFVAFCIFSLITITKFLNDQ